MSFNNFIPKKVIINILLSLIIGLTMVMNASSGCFAEEKINWYNQIFYEVKPGDNLISISKKFNVSIESIINLNGIENPHKIYAGKYLIIPVQARTYTVQQGDSLWEIAQKFNTTIEKLTGMNKLKRPDLIYPGQNLKIPLNSLTVAKSRGIKRSDLIWPTRGVISSRFGPRWGEFHEGLDIASVMGTPIYAAAEGRVIFAGQAEGYGKLIKIAHRGNMTTYYGHCERILVKENQYVRQGQLIALMGNTGRSTGTHLHFEVRFNGKPEDPLKILPWGYLET